MKRTSFCEGWEFSRDGGPFTPVNVPHDAMLGNRRGPDAPAASASGYYHGADYRYRKQFTLDARQASSTLLLEFEGIYRDARVTVNGHELPAPPYGFVPFFVDLSKVVHEGENSIEVEASNADQPDCRWYSGGGLYRPVWLWEGGPVRIMPEGVKVTTTSLHPARIHIDIEATGGKPLTRVFDECGPADANGAGLKGIARTGTPSAHDGGSTHASAEGDAPADTGTCVAQGGGFSLELEISNARLWSADSPHLYRCVVELSDERTGEVVDVAEVRFGIRMLTWDASFGLRVNDEEVLLRGGCIHCDNGILGAATFRTSERRRVRLLKEAGFNAIRVAHNPAPSTLLEACDELGMYVMDEAWDMWFMSKSAHDYAERFLDWCDYDLRRLVAHDFNHPSVIMYSIGNEIADPIGAPGVALERSLVDLVHALDPTRPVTCGFNLTMMVMERIGRGWYSNDEGVAQGAQSAPESKGSARGSLLFNLAAQATGSGMTLLANAPGADALVSPALDALDVAGYNYAAARYPIDVRKHADRIIVGSETFPHELDRNWKMIERYPALIGDFMWAAWDYLGEAGAGAWAYTAEEAGFAKPWPWLIAGSGALDILGNPNAAAAFAAAVWKTADAPSIQVRPVNIMNARTYRATWRGTDAIPSWSWRGCEGGPAEVEVYDGRAAAIRLELNGVVVGTRRVRRFVARFSLDYQPGRLVAVSLDAQGAELARSELETATGELRLAAHPEPAAEITYIPIAIEGANGMVESNADEELTVSVESGELLAFGSARPATTESFLAGRYTTYRGRALAIVAGHARLTISGTTLVPITVEV